MLKKTLLLIFLGIFFTTGCAETPNNLSETELRQAVDLAGQWFLNNQNDNFLYYEYYPATNTHSEETHQLRELASLWSITNMANFTGDQKYQELTDRGLNYFERFIYDDKSNGFSYLKFGNQEVKLGNSAFMLLTLVDSGRPDREDIITRLADGIVFHQKEDGSLRTHFYSDKNSSQDYYPGEALVALMTLYEKNGNQKYLDAVDKAFLYYQNYWNSNPNTAFIPWQTRAYYKFYQSNPDQAIADFIFTMNDYLLDQYNPADNCDKFTFDQGSVTAVHLEGTIQAYKLARELDDQTHQNCYQNFINQGLAYISTLQVQPDSGFPETATGGIWDGPAHISHRVDRNQHAVMAFMDYLTAINTNK